jgi:hypothetical protein
LSHLLHSSFVVFLFHVKARLVSLRLTYAIHCYSFLVFENDFVVHSLNQGGRVAVVPSSEISHGFEVHNSSFFEEDFRFELMIQSFRL